MEQDTSAHNETQESDKLDTSRSSTSEEASPRPKVPYALHIDLEDKENEKGDAKDATPNATKQNKKRPETAHTVRAPYAQPILDASKIDTKKSTVEERLASAKERRLQQQRQIELGYKSRREKEDIAHAKWVQTLEEKRRKIEENKMKDDAHRREVEQRKQQQLDVDKKKAEAKIARTEQVYEVTMRQKRSSSSDRGMKRWSWGDNNEQKSASHMNLSGPNPMKASDKFSRSPLHMNTSHMAFASGLRSYDSQEKLTKGTSPGRTGAPGLTEPISISPRLLAPTRSSLARSRTAVNDVDDNASQSSNDSKPIGPMRSRSKDRRNKDQTTPRPGSSGTSPRVDSGKNKPTPERKATPTRGTSPMATGRRAPSPAALQSLTAPTASSEAKKAAAKSTPIDNKGPQKRGVSPHPRPFRAPSPASKSAQSSETSHTTPTRTTPKRAPSPKKASAKKVQNESPKPASTPPSIKQSLRPTSAAQMKPRSSPSGTKPAGTKTAKPAATKTKPDTPKLIQKPKQGTDKPEKVAEKSTEKPPEESVVKVTPNPPQDGATVPTEIPAAPESNALPSNSTQPEKSPQDKPSTDKITEVEPNQVETNEVEQVEDNTVEAREKSGEPEHAEGETNEVEQVHNETTEAEQRQDEINEAEQQKLIDQKENVPPQPPIPTSNAEENVEYTEAPTHDEVKNVTPMPLEEPTQEVSDADTNKQTLEDDAASQNEDHAKDTTEISVPLDDDVTSQKEEDEPPKETTETLEGSIAPQKDEATEDNKPSTQPKIQLAAESGFHLDEKIENFTQEGVKEHEEQPNSLLDSFQTVEPADPRAVSPTDSLDEIVPEPEEQPPHVNPDDTSGEYPQPEDFDSDSESEEEEEPISVKERIPTKKEASEEPAPTEPTVEPLKEELQAPPLSSGEEKEIEDDSEPAGIEESAEKVTEPDEESNEKPTEDAEKQVDVAAMETPESTTTEENADQAAANEDNASADNKDDIEQTQQDQPVEIAPSSGGDEAEQTKEPSDNEAVNKNEATENAQPAERKSQPRKNLETEEEKEAYRQAIAEKRRELKEKKEQEERERQERIRLAKTEQAKREEEARRMFEEAAAEAEREKQLREEREKQEAEEELRRQEEEKRKEEEANARKREAAEKIRKDRELQKQKQEDERMARKKRLEMIMRRTRQPDASDSAKKTDDSASPVGTPSPQHTPTILSPSSGRSPQTQSPVGGRSPLTATTPERSISPAIAAILNRNSDASRNSDNSKTTSDKSEESSEPNLLNFTNSATKYDSSGIEVIHDGSGDAAEQTIEKPVPIEAFTAKNIMNGMEGNTEIHNASNGSDPFNLFSNGSDAVQQQTNAPVNGNDDLLGLNSDVMQQQKNSNEPLVPIEI